MGVNNNPRRNKPAPQPGEYVRVKLPNQAEGQIFAIADQIMGASHIKIMCADGKSRLGRIPGKMKRRMWIKPGDLLIVTPWYMDDEKADIKWRYTEIESVNLSKRGLIPKDIDLFK
ncbi:MAG: translation initiation factor eIF-1A [Candidatus Thermoplasmatota archaeon]|nr:translation initiation factor eIF-1A [Candidatus Thermoplasmatota archaeon]